MSTVYQQDGQSLYDFGGVTYDAKTGMPADKSVSSTLSATLNAGNSVTPTSSPTILSSAQGAQTVQQAQQTAAKLTPLPPATTETKTQTTETPTSKVTLVNPSTDQTIAFENADLNKDNIQGYLNAGYVMSDASGTIPSWLKPSTGTSPELDQANSELATAKNELDTYKAKLTNFDVSSDPQLQSVLSGISSQWDARISDMERANKNRESSLNTTGIRLGSRWTGGAGGVMGGIVSEEERQGISRIAQLQAEKQSALTAARSAYEDQKWDQYYKLVGIAQKHYSDQLQAVSDLNKATAQQNAKLQEQASQSDRDSAILSLYEKGTTDPAAIFNAIKSSGRNDVALKDVTSTLKLLAKETGADSLEKLGGDTRDFYLLQRNNLLPGGVSDLGGFLKYVNSAKQDPAKAQINNLSIAQKSLAINRTNQLIESAKALEASRIVTTQVNHDAGVQNYLKIQPVMDRLRAAQQDIEQRGINQSNAADLLDAITQINTGGKVITEGQIDLTKESQSYTDRASALLQKIRGQGGVISPKIADDAIELSKKIYGLYQGEYKKRISIYSNRLSNVNGQDLRAYSPLTDITNLPAVLDGSYQGALDTDNRANFDAVNQISAQDLLDNPPEDASSYDPNMWNN